MRRLVLGIAALVGLAVSAQTFLGASQREASLDRSPAVASETTPALALVLDPSPRVVANAPVSAKPLPVTVTLAERELTAAAAAYFPVGFSGATLSDPVVRLVGGRLVLDAAAKVAIVRTTARVVATPLVANGRASARVDLVTLGGRALPEAVRQSVAADISRAIASAVPANVTVTSIAVGEGTLTVRGVANP